MDLVRKILIFMSTNEEGPNIDWSASIPGYTEDQILHHAALMKQGGLINAGDYGDLDNALPLALPVSITWDGHEFLAGIQDPGDWAKIKKNVIGPAGSVVVSVIKDYITMELKGRLGIA